MKIALYQPDIAGNVGTMIRLGACMGINIDIIEPCGFPFSKEKIRRSGMDYIDHVKITRYASFEEFKEKNKKSRVVLLTTKSEQSYIKFSFKKDDILMVGRESAGVPDTVHKNVEARILIPMKNKMRSLNVAVSLSMVLGEAMRQTDLLL